MGVSRRDPLSRRIRALPLTCLVLVLLLAVPSAHAQDGNLFGVTIAAEPATDSVQDLDSCATYTITVRNTGQSPIPQEHNIQLSTSTAPAGWTVDPAPPESMTLASGARDSFPLGLCPTEEAAPGSDVALTITATVTEQASGNPSDDTTVTAALDEESLFGLDIPDAFLWLILGGLALLVGIILLSRKRTTHGVTLVCTESSKEVHAGRGTSFPIRIRNEGSERDLVSLDVSRAPPGWDTFLPLSDLALDAGEEQTVWLSVRSPDEAEPGQEVTVRVTARSGGPTAEQAAIDTHTRVAAETTRQPSAPPEGTPIELEETDDTGDEERGERSVLDEPAERPLAVKRKKSRRG